MSRGTLWWPAVLGAQWWRVVCAPCAGRLLLYVDTGSAVGQDTVIPATLDGQGIAVQPVWSCR